MILTKIANIYVHAIKFGAATIDWYVPHVQLNS